MNETKIQWTDKTWNPTRGCSRVSPGCENCYAERVAARFVEPLDTRTGLPMTFHGFAERRKNGGRWTGKLALIDSKLSEPMRWSKPSRIFVNSMSDLFHEKLDDEEIAAVFGVMAACPRHTFQVLTKRAERMARWLDWAGRLPIGALGDCAEQHGAGHGLECYTGWPLPNVWLGVSVEDQQRADERIPELLATPAAIRFLSVEPLLGPVDLWAYLKTPTRDESLAALGSKPMPGIDWVIVGGESGPDARPCAFEWIQRVVDQCREAGVACFVKQVGAFPVSEERTAPLELARSQGWPEPILVAPSGEAWAWRAGFRDRKGGDPDDWPEEMRVREYPAVRR